MQTSPNNLTDRGIIKVVDEREFLLLVRQALLMLVDAIERKLEVPRTSEIRKNAKLNQRFELVDILQDRDLQK